MSGKRRSGTQPGGPAKKVKTGDGMGECNTFVDGAIVRLTVKDFLTYSDCEYRFGPGLNVLLGPNGTGKSSVVCALCLGLAGAQQLLGRAREVGDFVRHGQEEAWIHVEVFRDDGNVIFTRHIKREGNLSFWKINRQPSTQKKVQEQVAQLNIQLGNMCQFLPQDRVVDFARMTPSDLLKATVQAVGTDSMYNDHQSLIELRKREKELEEKSCRNTEDLERLKHQNSLLDRDVQRYQERQQFMLKVRDLENKRPWVEYEEVRTEYAQAHEDTKAARQSYEEQRQQHAPLRAEVDAAKVHRADFDKQSLETAKLVNKAASDCRKLSDRLDTLEEEMAEPAQRLEAARRNETQRQRKIAQAEQAIRQHEEELSQAPAAEQLKPQLQEATARLREVNTSVMRLQQQQTALRAEQEPQAKDIARLEAELKRLEDVSNRRLQQLRQADRDTYNAVQWLRSNQDRFKQHVYEPVLMAVNMKKAEDASYFEQVVGFKSLISFTCQSDEDLKLFLKLVRDQQNLRVNAGAVPDVPMDTFRRKANELANVKQRYEFRSSLLDLVEGPEAVLRYLCRRHRIHDTLIGTDRTEANVDKVIQDSPLHLFCTPKSMYSIKTSRYGDRHKSTQVNDIRPGRFLNVAVDSQRREQIQHELTDVRTSLENCRQRLDKLREEERHLRLESSNVKKLKDDLQALKDKSRTIESQLSTAKQRRQRYVTDAVDLDQVEEEVKESLKQINIKRAQLATEMEAVVKKVINLTKEKTLLDMHALQEMMREDQLQDRYRNASTSLREAEDAFREIERRSKELKQQAKDKHRLAQHKLGIAESKPSADVIAVFNNYPSTLVEIDDMIHDLKTRADLNYHTDPKVVEEYEKRKAEIDKMASALDGEKGDLQSMTEEISTVRDRWLTPLKELIGKINKQYGDFFSMLGCNGAVELETHEDYDKYAIRILVRFHAAQKLHVLTAHHQSGGERSVSTMLYLMALQELTRFPFRLVDEINQGMDPNNERRVFEFVVGEACRPGTSQYFLITPKLLANLKYRKNMKVHCIYSGTEVNKAGQADGHFDPHRLVNRMRSAGPG